MGERKAKEKGKANQREKERRKKRLLKVKKGEKM